MILDETEQKQEVSEDIEQLVKMNLDLIDIKGTLENIKQELKTKSKYLDRKIIKIERTNLS